VIVLFLFLLYYANDFFVLTLLFVNLNVITKGRAGMGKMKKVTKKRIK